MSILIRIPLKFKNINIIALIDTGAAVSVVSLLVFQKLPSAGKRKLYNDHSLLFRSATGHELVVTGYFNITFQLESTPFQNSFYVIKNITEECIIGMDFLSRTIFSFNGPGRTLKIETEEKTIEVPYVKHLQRHEVNSIKAIPLPTLEHLDRKQRKALHNTLQKNMD